MEPISHSHAISNSFLDPQLRDQRALIADLNNLKEEVSRFSHRDEITSEALEWIQLFQQALRQEGNVEEVKARFFPLLGELLKDPLTQQMYEDQTYLGSDGHTYGHASLTICYLCMPNREGYPSPFEPEQFPHLVLKEHKAVGALLRFLEKYGKKETPAAHLTHYHTLESQGNIPPFFLPTEYNLRIQAVRRATTLVDPNIEMDEDLSFARDLYAPLHQRLDEIRNELEGELESVEQVQNQLLQEVRERLAALEVETASLHSELTRLHQEIDAENRNLQGVSESMGEINRNLGDLAERIKKKNKNEWKTLLMAAAVISVCFVASAALSGVLLNGSGSVALFPSSGGMKIGFGLAL